MKYEIINPSDKCFLESDNEKAAVAGCLLLGLSKNAPKDGNDEQVCPLLLFESESFLRETYGGTKELSAYLDEECKAISEVAGSFHYDSKRSSMNNIGAEAKRIAQTYKALAEVKK